MAFSEHHGFHLVVTLMEEASRRGLPLWVTGGWAIDARLGRITRVHDDIDLAYPGERRLEFLDLLAAFGIRPTEETDYGFLAEGRGFLLDCEPCWLIGGRYEIEGAPSGSCPFEPQGALLSHPLLCSSWPALIWDYLHYEQETPLPDWPEKQRQAWRLIQTEVGDDLIETLRRQFLTRKPSDST